MHALAADPRARSEPGRRGVRPRLPWILPLLVTLFTAAAVSPVHAGAWTLPAGQLWAKASFLYQFTHDFYADTGAILPDGTVVEPGDRRPYDDGGASRQRVIFVDAEYGVTDRLTVGAQIPWKELRFDDRIETTKSWGAGDLKTALRYALLTGRDRLTIRTAVKWPTGRFSVEPGKIPLGENQADLETGLQWGRGLGRPMSWVGAEAGRRFRFRDDENGIDPGDEWFWWTEAGWGLDRRGRTGLKVYYQGARGDSESVNFFAPGTALSRDFDEVGVTAMVDLPWTFLELGWSHVLSSETYPAAPVWSVGISRAVGLR